jgi:lysophospholipase L1-like esterase
MKSIRFSRIIAALSISAAMLVAVAVAKDAPRKPAVPPCNPAVTPAGRSDAWWRQRHESMNARVQQGDVDLIFIGDSITHGWEGGGKEVWQRFYGSRNAVNLGIGGDQTCHVLWRLDNGNIAGISPKLAVIMIGTNNAGSGHSAEQTTAGVKAIVGKLRTKLPQTKIVLLAIFPRGADDKDALRQINTKTNKAIAKLADGRNVFYLDIGPKFLCPDGTLSKQIMPDLLHPNAKGYEIWAEAIEPTVTTLMGDNGMATIPMPRDGGWMQRHDSFNARVKKGNVDLIFIGDSITHGWEGSGKDVWQRFYGNRNAVNLGISGDQTAQVLWRLDHGNIDGISPKLAVMMIGTNNAGHTPHQTPEQIAAGVKAIVDRLQAKLPQTKLLLLAVFPRGADNNDCLRQINMKANEMFAKLADGKKVFYLDVSSKFLCPDGTLSKQIMPDLLHPNAKGYEIWAEAIEPDVAKLMGRPVSAALPISRNNDAWWRQRNESFNARVKQGNVDLVFLGDSITQGWEGAKEVWQKYYDHRNAVNLGIGGDQTGHVLWRLDHGNIDGISPKLAVLMIGTNNIGGYTPAEIAGGIKAIVEKLREKAPSTKVLVLGVFPRGATADDPLRKQQMAINKIVAKLADCKTVFFLDISPKFLSADGVLSKNVFPDLVHLTPKSYQTWAEAIEPTVVKLMDEK